MLTLIRDRNSLDLRLKRREQALSMNKPVVHEILNRIKTYGDEAVRDLTRKYDKVEISDLQISKERLDQCSKKINPTLRSAIRQAGENILKFHKVQFPKDYSFNQTDGTEVSFRWRPIERIGVYVPGGGYPLFSTVLMNVIPAQVAGVKEIVLCTPPGKDGVPDELILGTCSLLGITKVFGIGGAQAIGAMAYGTESIPAVSKITGPGNVFVMTAKQIVSNLIGIDMIAGPTELVVIADENADPRKTAIELISQAEHDSQALPILLTPSEQFCKKVTESLMNILGSLPPAGTIELSLENQGFIYLAKNLEECIQVANQIAPEHLSLQINQPEEWVGRIIAGAIFVGSDTPVAWGDYWAGPNHILPTSGQARFRGPLSVLDFMVPYSVIQAGSLVLKKTGAQVMNLAKAEGLAGHALSVAIRMEDD